MNKSLKILLAVVLVAAVGLQVANHVVVHDKLCSLADVGCGSVFGSGSVKGRWQGSESLPSAGRGVVVGFTAGTALVRKKIDGRWAAGFGALELVATLPGVPLYAACGFVALAELRDRLPDGVEVHFVHMRKELAAERAIGARP